MEIVGIVVSIAILITSVVIHEIAHGFAAYKLGDPTAKYAGRLTLNPIPHLDPIGSILTPGVLIILGTPFLFGWAKPVPFNPYNLKHPRRDEAIIAFAGPLSNIILAVAAALVYRILVPDPGTIVATILASFIFINLVLAVFNLVPIPPLDGSKLVFSAFPSIAVFRETLESIGFFLIILFIISPFSDFIAPLVSAISSFLVGSG
jgi:Zn-dependent protease